MSVEKEIETLEEQNPVTANATAGDKLPKKLEGETPGNSTSADLGGPVVKPDDTASIGKKLVQWHMRVISPSRPSSSLPLPQRWKRPKSKKKSSLRRLKSKLMLRAMLKLLNGEEFSEDFKFK